MNVIKWEPFDDFDRSFGGRPSPLFSKFSSDLAVDVYEEDDTVIVRINLAGVNPDALDISIVGDMLVVAGIREEENEIEKKNYYSKEIRRGSFFRTVSLPRMVDAAGSSAEYEDGLLTIVMPSINGTKERATRVPIRH